MDFEESRTEFSVNGIQVKEISATKSSLSKEEVHWMMEALENCKIHAMAMVKLHLGGSDIGFCGASLISEVNLRGVKCHIIRCINLHAFSPYKSTLFEQQLYPRLMRKSKEEENKILFVCLKKPVILNFKDPLECKKFYLKMTNILSELDSQEDCELNCENSIAKINVENKGVEDPLLAESIERTCKKNKIEKVPLVADGLADLISVARKQSIIAQHQRDIRTGSREIKIPVVPKNSTFNHPPPSTPAPPPPVKSSAVDIDMHTTTPVMTITSPPKINPRESKILKWQEEVNKPHSPHRGIVSFTIVVKTKNKSSDFAFGSETLAGEVVDVVAPQFDLDPDLFGLFRRSGLPLDPKLTLFQNGVVAAVFFHSSYKIRLKLMRLPLQDILELKPLQPL